MKKNFFKKLTIPLTAILLISSPLSTPLNALADENTNQPLVVISPEAESIPNYIVEQIIEENPDAGVINIYDYGDMPNTDVNNIDKKEPIITPQTSLITLIENVKTTKTVTDSNHLAKDEFKFSVAKGEEVTLSYTYSGELTGSISGISFNKADIGAEITIKGEYKKGTKYSGPGESSSYNTREFRMKFYEELGTYKQTADRNTYFSGKLQSTEKVAQTGTYKKPTKFASYSIDKKI